MAPDYRPNQRLYPDRLAEELGVSITPIREALRILSAHGFVELLPRRGARVASLTTEEIVDLTAVRGGIEALAIQLHKGEYSPSEISDLTGCLDVCHTAIISRAEATFRTHDTEFHHLLISSTHSRTLLALYEQLHRRGQILELYFTDTWEWWSQSLQEHREIVQFLKQGALGKAQATVSGHWARSGSRISNKFRVIDQANPTGKRPHLP
jgi:DNA-binding GntR family transcriptional regulator